MLYMLTSDTIFAVDSNLAGSVPLYPHLWKLNKLN